ncbi:hypothetical protein PoB_005215200 [Plakobranchus ocellatus]|uniref:Uncharacterized protein n=1 Tax=Plakobranchus ocellatus TaxID=259542 RepID=A0AAV4C214_9GAST|nr:hypothetical protein PoB_005215200 [Plakobranchus ocellatus]
MTLPNDANSAASQNSGAESNCHEKRQSEHTTHAEDFTQDFLGKMAAQYERIDDKCNENAEVTKTAYYYKEEHLEIDLFQREWDLRHRQLTCRKNPGHENFLPVKEFTLDDLPAALRHQEVLNYIQAVCPLVVRQRVVRQGQKYAGGSGSSGKDKSMLKTAGRQARTKVYRRQRVVRQGQKYAGGSGLSGKDKTILEAMWLWGKVKIVLE